MSDDDDLPGLDSEDDGGEAPKTKQARRRGTPKSDVRNVAKKAMAKVGDLQALGFEESRRLLYHGHVLLATATHSKVEPPYQLSDFDAAGDYLATLSKEIKWLRLPPRALAAVGFVTEEAQLMGRWMDGLPEDSGVRRAFRRGHSEQPPEQGWNPYVVPGFEQAS